jgi:FAD/FMN-containing dehydrogenase
VLDLGGLDAIRLEAQRGTVVVGPGVRLVDLDAALAARGLTVPAGSCPTVGVGGLALGGGVGLASRRFGLTCDNVVELEVVTADGRRRRCSARREPELYWALRGGGAGLGVVTALRLRVHRVASASTFNASWPWERAADVLEAWQRLAPDAPDALYALCGLGVVGPSISCYGQHLGSEAELRRLLAPLRAVDGVRLSTSHAPYRDVLLRFAGCASLGLAACHLRGESPAGTLGRARFAAKSDYVDEPLGAAGIAALLRAVEDGRRTVGAGSRSVILDPYGGAINRVAPDATAFVHRRSRFSLQYLAYWPAGEERAGVAWLRSAHARLRPHVSGAAYQNYLDPDLRDWQGAYWGRNAGRLQAAKRRYDPDWLFRSALAVTPGVAVAAGGRS